MKSLNMFLPHMTTEQLRYMQHYKIELRLHLVLIISSSMHIQGYIISTVHFFETGGNVKIPYCLHKKYTARHQIHTVCTWSTLLNTKFRTLYTRSTLWTPNSVTYCLHKKYTAEHQIPDCLHKKYTVEHQIPSCLYKKYTAEH